jgi:hypothetical protein
MITALVTKWYRIARMSAGHIGEIQTMRARLSLILAFAVLPVWHAGAQSLPWPTDPRQSGAAPPWPGAGTPVVAAPPAASPQPMPVPGFGAPQPPPEAQACLAEFTKLRLDVEQRGKSAKAANDRKVSREEMCKYVTAYSAAEVKWAKFTEDNQGKCGIPPQIVTQLKTARGNTETMRERICAPAPSAPAPSLSDALGTTRLPTPETTKTHSGTLDTLTGNALQTR